ncbi:polyamine aminopropyltransferase [Methylotenera sp.]|uniref:polyamine aminopropyltransferase n=1 Tax=Methylotenera sp. TaxID=2051956 RepID=UPI002731FDE4|nr:polyamine aminopropyltransferase [Methylotenera sp.]MDP2072012.1 polyamine aminopropyltransferase [Methylotenera sp.]MDP3006979.1 polyamine aminopropyltransferase [Methylotenera sp.]MDP3007084.1 polyamine aminopropyltransferase [Methylotenera sp.]
MFRVAKHLLREFTKASAANDTVDVSEADGVRSLHLGSVTIQSAMRIRDPFALELAYTRGIMCFLLFKQNVNHMLTIGLGGGSVAKYVHANCSDIASTIIEINPRIIQVARSQFYVPENDERFEVIEGDGLHYLAEHTADAEVLLIDAFDRNGIPSDFCSQDFFDQCATTLKQDGVFVINLWGSDKNFDVYLRRIEQSFDGRVLVLPTGKPGNIVVFGFKREPSDLRLNHLRDRAKLLEKTHQIEFLQFIEKLAEHNPSSSNRLFLNRSLVQTEI